MSWSPVTGENVEYRVYRASTDNPASAIPIGEGWQTGTTFNDITAQVPVVMPGPCNLPGMAEPVSYFYWVRAREGEGCESALSATPAEGYRVQAKRSETAAVLPLEGAGRLMVFGALGVAFLLLGRCAGRGGDNSKAA